jgi:hypothetical protein
VPTVADRGIRLTVEEVSQGRALVKAGDDMRNLGNEVDKTDNKFARFTEDTKKVNAELEKSTQKVKDLRQQFARTGDQSLLGDIRKEEARARSFKSVLTGLRKDAEQEGVIVGATFTNSFTKQLSSLGEGGGGAGMPAVIAAIGTLLAVSAAPIGAMISGAVVGAVGTGGIVGGVVAASHDPRVKDAFSTLVAVAKDTFFDAGASFVGPTLVAVRMLQDELGRFNLAKTFAAFAPDLTIIVKGLVDFLNALKLGLDNLAGRSRLFAQGAAEGFKMVGAALGKFLDQVSSSPGALEGLKAIFVVLAGTIRFLGTALNWLSNIFHAFNVASLAFFEGTQKFLAAAGIHNKTIDDTVTGLKGLVQVDDDAMNAQIALGNATAEAADDAKKQADALQRENDELQNTIDLISKALGIMLSLDEAQLRLQDDISGFNKDLAENGKLWNENTDAGRKQREEFLGLIADAGRIRDAQIAAGKSVKDANAEYDAQVQSLLKLAGQAGATKKQLDDLAHTYEIKFSIDAIAGAVSNVAAAVSNALRGLSFGGNPQKSATFGGGRAVGGPVSAGTTYLVGERGPELLHMGSNGYVDSKAGGASQVVVSFEAPPAGSGLEELWRVLRKYIRINGGDVQTVLGV